MGTEAPFVSRQFGGVATTKEATARHRATLGAQTAVGRGGALKLASDSLGYSLEWLRPEQIVALQQTVGNQAVQRLFARSGGARLAGRPLAVQRKLKWDDPGQWDGAKFLDASSGGGGGVLFVGQDKPREVVVKPGEDMAEEGAMAALLHGEVGRAGKFGITMAPGFRLAASKESQDIKKAVTPLLDQAGSTETDAKKKLFKKNRAKDLVALLDQPGVVVQDIARGGEFRDVVKEVKNHTEKKLLGGRKFTKKSPLRIFKDRRSIQALGMATAVDLFTGNRDRLFMFNPDNFFVSPYSITMIDNIWMGTDMSYFQTRQVEGGDGKITITADEGLKKWKADSEVKRLAQGDYDPIGKLVWGRIGDAVAQGVLVPAASKSKVDRQAAAKAQKAVKEALSKYESRFLKYFSNGLAAGKKQLLVSLDSLIADRSRLQVLAPGADLNEIIATIKKRRDFLKGQ